MRLDKFLKVARLIKQRQKAKNICDMGAAKINGQIAKAGTKVKLDDIIDIVVGNRRLTAQILKVPTGNVAKQEAASLIDIKKEIILNED